MRQHRIQHLPVVDDVGGSTASDGDRGRLAIRSQDGASMGKSVRTILLLFAALLAVACTTSPHRYRYEPPGPVRPSDWNVCHAEADAWARQRYARYMEIIELAGPFGGMFGGTTLAQRAWDEREEVYERELKACLAARGYVL